MSASKKFPNIANLQRNNLKGSPTLAKPALAKDAKRVVVEPQNEATAQSEVSNTRADLSAMARLQEPSQATPPAQKVELCTAAKLIEGRNLTNKSTPKECEQRFNYEIGLLENGVIGVINDLSKKTHLFETLYRGGKFLPLWPTIEINGIPSDFFFRTSNTNDQCALIWPFENQGPNGYRPEYNLYKDGDYELLSITDLPNKDGDLIFRCETVRNHLADDYNRSFKIPHPIKPGERVIRVLKRGPGGSYQEEILTKSFYSAREGRDTLKFSA